MKREKSNSFPRVPQVVRPEGAEAPSPGQRPGCNTSKAKRPVRAEAFIINAFALTGRIIYNVRLPRALPWARRNLGFQPAVKIIRICIQ